MPPPAFPLIDAHQHFWDPGVHYYPWLNDEPPIPFRYGDYRAIRRRYLPARLPAGRRGLQVLKTVYVETEWDPQDPVGEMRYVDELRRAHGLPTVAVAQAWLHHDDAAAAHREAGFLSIRAQRAAQAAAGRDARREVAPRLRGARAGNGLRFDLQTPWTSLGDAVRLADRVSPARRSSSTTPACLPTAAPQASQAGSAR